MSREINVVQDPLEPSRRGALQTVGGSALVGALLAGCGSATDQAGQVAGSVASAASDAASSVASGAASAASSAAGNLVKAADIPVGGGKVLTLLKVVITQPTAGDYKAFSLVCPHEGCAVNAVEGGQIICPCHGSTFDIATGKVTRGPAREGLAVKSISVTADGLQVS